ncbi:MAG: hypothetical protein SVY15_03775 [Halobacteriota archaeon]|nr:hypothetical protein [Halobacteriota archaeon]
MVSLETFSNALVSLVANIIEIIVAIVGGIIDHLSVDGMIGFMGYLVKGLDVLVEAIVPLIDPIVRIVLAIINITSANETVNTAFHNFTSTTSENLSVIIGPADASSGLTYVLDGVLTQTDTNVAAYFLQGLWDLLTVVVDLVAAALAGLGGI